MKTIKLFSILTVVSAMFFSCDKKSDPEVTPLHNFITVNGANHELNDVKTVYCRIDENGLGHILLISTKGVPLGADHNVASLEEFFLLAIPVEQFGKDIVMESTLNQPTLWQWNITCRSSLEYSVEGSGHNIEKMGDVVSGKYHYTHNNGTVNLKLDVVLKDGKKLTLSYLGKPILIKSGS